MGESLASFWRLYHQYFCTVSESWVKHCLCFCSSLSRGTWPTYWPPLLAASQRTTLSWRWVSVVYTVPQGQPVVINYLAHPSSGIWWVHSSKARGDLLDPVETSCALFHLMFVCFGPDSSLPQNVFSARPSNITGEPGLMSDRHKTRFVMR